MRTGNFSRRLSATGRDEFASLSDGFNRMSDKLANLVGQVHSLMPLMLVPASDNPVDAVFLKRTFDILASLVIALLCRGHVLLLGVPGLGKTLMARTLARTLDLEFRRIQSSDGRELFAFEIPFNKYLAGKSGGP